MCSGLRAHVRRGSRGRAAGTALDECGPSGLLELRATSCEGPQGGSGCAERQFANSRARHQTQARSRFWSKYHVYGHALGKTSISEAPAAKGRRTAPSQHKAAADPTKNDASHPHARSPRKRQDPWWSGRGAALPWAAAPRRPCREFCTPPTVSGGALADCQWWQSPRGTSESAVPRHFAHSELGAGR